MPIRIQRRRTKGWKMPENTVSVTRGTMWGNPFIVKPDVYAGKKIGGFWTAVPTPDDAVECFRLWAERRPEFLAAIRTHLAGKNLACFCPLDQPCHADVLLELANSSREEVA